MKPFLPHEVHPLLERVEVVDCLRLHEVRARLRLPAEVYEGVLHGYVEWVRRGANEDRRAGIYGVPAPEHALVAEVPEDLQEILRIQVEDGRGLRFVPRFRVVPAQRHDDPNPEGGGAEDVRLERDSIPVARCELHDRFQSLAKEKRGPRPRGNVDASARAVRNVVGVREARHPGRDRQNGGGIRRRGGHDLGGDGKAPRCEHALEATPALLGSVRRRRPHTRSNPASSLKAFALEKGARMITIQQGLDGWRADMANDAP